MKNDKFPGRLGLLRTAAIEGPVIHLADLERLSGLGHGVLQPYYPGPINDELRCKIAAAAAELLKLDADSMQVWLVGELDEKGDRYWPDVPCVEDYLRWLPTQVCCTRCGDWFDRGTDQYVAPLRRCRPCVRATQNPSAGLYAELLRARLPEIRARCPALADAVQVTLDAREAPTYERLAVRAQLAAIVVARILKGMGLDKRNLPNVAVKRTLRQITMVAVMLSSSPHAIHDPVGPPTTTRQNPT